MLKIKIFLFLCLWTFVEAVAGPGKVVVKGVREPYCVYNSKRTKEKKVFTPEKEQKGNVILLPEKECKDLFYLIVGEQTSWIRVQPDQTVTVDVAKTPWRFSGDGASVNSYLYGWTQKMYLDKSNLLLQRVENMMTHIPRGLRSYLEAAAYFTPEYQEWVKQLLPSALADLDRAELPDERFVKEQKERIRYAWWELQLHNYQRAKGRVEIPAVAVEFVKDIRFDDDQLLDYPGFNDIINPFFAVNGDYGWLACTHKDFLRRQAGRIGSPAIREAFVLNELENIITRGRYVYQTGEVLESVKDMVVSEQGRQRYAVCQDAHRRHQEEDFAGKMIYRFEFEDKDGKTVTSADFVGKYLFIDIWATWCAPCKYQIPHLLRLEKELEGRDIEFLSISVDKPEDKQKWLDMLEQFGMEGNCVISPDAFKYEMFKQYGVSAIPRFMLVDPEGKIVFSRGRRPSDPVLKMQLVELLDQYEKKKGVASGNIPDFEGGSVSLMLPGGMYKILGGKTVKNGKFEINFTISEPAFLTLVADKKPLKLWAKPGGRVNITWEGRFVVEGDNADVSNMLILLKEKYPACFSPSRGSVLDKKRSAQLMKNYRILVADVEQSALAANDKKLVTGYLQGELFSTLFSPISSSKVFGKGIPKPVVKKDYMAPVLKFQPSPEIVNSTLWLDGMQEFLYALLDAGKIKIKSSTTRLADMAQGIADPVLQEEYIMESLRMEILRGHFVNIAARIEAVRPFVRKMKNVEELNAMPAQIVKGAQRYQNTLPGTDLSAFRFSNEKGETVSLGDFEGKYIFIDLWSTGCNPCIGEIPYIKEMEHYFAGKPIVWVSISLDSKEKVWKDFLAAQKMTGIQLLCDQGTKHPFIRQIGLSGIPRFMLLDKDGKVVDYNTLRPSSPVLKEEIKLLLK